MILKIQVSPVHERVLSCSTIIENFIMAFTPIQFLICTWHVVSKYNDELGFGSVFEINHHKTYL